jgi:hypothetical protein
LRRNCLLKHVIEGKIEGRIKVTEDEEEDVSSYWMALRKKRRYWKLKEETLARTLENSLWKRLWTCYKTDYGMKGIKLAAMSCTCISYVF